MNSDNVSSYPAALYSAVSEIGYRQERFTGEVLRSGAGRRGTHRRSRVGSLRRRRSAGRPRPVVPAGPRGLHRTASAH